MGGEERFARLRHQMIERQLRSRNIRDDRVLEAMSTVLRHLHVPETHQHLAYEDSPVPIGRGQTISQPYVVAFMTQALALQGTERVLEIGTGSGYQTGVLARLVSHVYSVEVDCQLAKSSSLLLDKGGYTNITTRCGDGYGGWPEHAPFDAIMVTAAPPSIPEALIEQLANGGKMVIPVGDQVQSLRLISKGENGVITEHDLLPVRFVPMVPGE